MQKNSEKLVLKARADLNRLINFQTPIEDEPDLEVKASFILTTLKNDLPSNQNKSKTRTDPAVRAGGKLTTDRRDALQALKIAFNEVEEEDAPMEEDSPPKPVRPARPSQPVYQENVPQPQVPRRPRVVIHRQPAAAPQPQPLLPSNRVYGTGARTFPAPAVPQAPQPFDFSSLVTSIAMQHMQQSQFNPYQAGHYYTPTAPASIAAAPSPPPPPPPPPQAPLPPAQIAAMAEQLQRHIAQYIQIHSGYLPLPFAPPPPGPPPMLPPSPGTSAAMALELQQGIALFMQAHSSYMYPIRAPQMPFPFPMPYSEHWKPPTEAAGESVDNRKSSATSSNAPPKAAPGALKSKDPPLVDEFKIKTSAFTSMGRAFGNALSHNDTTTSTREEDGDGAAGQDSQGRRRQSQRKTKKPVRNTDKAFEFKENNMKTGNTYQKNWYVPRPSTQSSHEVKRGLAPAAAAEDAAPAVDAPKPKEPAPAPAPEPAQKALRIYSSEPVTSAEPDALANNLGEESLEAQIKRKTITAVNNDYWAEMPEDIQIMERAVLDFTKPYTPSGPSFFTPKIKALQGAAMYAAQLEVIEKRLAWVAEEMKKDGIVYGWKKGKEPAAGSYEFYRGIALKYLRDRLKSRCRVEAIKRDKEKK